ncbi:hypothetical protein Z517_05464 [Fonsecaea pedrosoi CBS 271.37]|uniref:BPL/LPL catalytic domain-containing protein n=1 Tax=Fonsecaea pedrosoi CBS 271.37 TaxID=1442368 RepID=A0A0D2F772_9EURO|nr:uncharacterized protein Z517_05464 [Fonsecaea pedrosoi CBS 271.37]KIW82437.1 hypothetical protein Z517_05464 [Fonsecaea pedrosoi CBS 271.37]
MRLAHLHVPDLIPYSHSLRLQTAILERHFQHKDWLRSDTRGDSLANEGRRNKATNNAHPTEPGDKGKGSGRQSWQSIINTKTSDAAAAADENDDAARARTLLRCSTLRNDRPESSMLGARKGNCTTKNTTTALHHNASSLPALDVSSSSHELSHIQMPPDPVLLTFSTPPTYTVGRRHLLTNPISADQQTFLSANGLATFHASPRGGLLTYHAPGQLTGYVIVDLRRFGITARCWVKLLEESVMRTCSRWGVRTGRTDDPGVWVLNPGSAADQERGGRSASRPPKGTAATDRKICAIGVQVSRGVTSHGVGLNVYDAPLPPSATPSSASFSTGLSSSPGSIPLLTSPFPSAAASSSGRRLYDFIPAQTSSPSYDPLTRGYLSWGFSRIVACGLEGKSVTWLTREMLRSHPNLSSTAIPNSDQTAHEQSSSLPSTADPGEKGVSLTTDDQPQLIAESISMESVADVFAHEIVHGLNAMKTEGRETVDGVYRVQESDFL